MTVTRRGSKGHGPVQDERIGCEGEEEEVKESQEHNGSAESYGGITNTGKI